MLALPAALGLAILATPLVATMYHYGRFSAADVVATHWALLAYAGGLIGLILVKVLAPGFYARQDMRTPVRYAIFTLILTQVLNVILMGPLQHAGLALAISIGACVNAGLLWRGLVQRDAYHARPGWGMFLAKLALALLLMGGVLWLLNPSAETWLAMRATPLMRVLWLAGVVGAGALVYFATLWAAGFRLRDFKRVV
jgi:putative peptidoglycan lipid II flippase